MDSSPRFRSTDSRCESNGSPSHGPTKLRLMCSNGGHIVPRPHDKSLRYIGGETRMVTVDRHTTLLDLTRRITKTISRLTSSSTTTSPPAFTIKYQLPSEDLDSLISITTDEDLENMIDEHERLNSSSRLRLFIFPASPESISSLGSFLENPSKSEDWFFNALNGTNSGFSDTSSANCLLDMNDETSLLEKKDVSHKERDLVVHQDVQSILDSPLVETNSSFGSESSTRSHANLQPIRVNADDHPKNDRGLMASLAQVVVSGSLSNPAKATKEHSDPFLSYHERPDQGLPMNYLKHQQEHHQQQRNQSTGFDLAATDSLLSGLAITDQSSPVSQIQSPSYSNRAADPNDTHDQNTRIQMLQQEQQKIHNNSAYLSSKPTTQLDSPRHQLLGQQPQLTLPLQYHPSMAVPVTCYYQHPPTDQQNLMYYIPNNQTAMKPELPVYTTTNAGGQQLVRVHSGFQNQPQYQLGQPIYYATPLSNLQEQQVRTAQP